MSIQSELTRLTNAKSSIVAAIEGKGVTVPDGTLLDGMASLIESIQTGGVLEIVNGSFIPAEDVISFVVHHNLGRIPKLAFLLLADNNLLSRANPTARFVMSVQALENGNIIIVSNYGRAMAERPSYLTNWMSSSFMKFDETTITFGSTLMNDTYWMLKAGVEYIWLIVG